MILTPLTDITESAITQKSRASSGRKIMFRREEIINSIEINVRDSEVYACHKKAPFIKIALLYTRKTHLSRVYPAGDEGKVVEDGLAREPKARQSPPADETRSTIAYTRGGAAHASPDVSRYALTSPTLGAAASKKLEKTLDKCVLKMYN